MDWLLFREATGKPSHKGIPGRGCIDDLYPVSVHPGFIGLIFKEEAFGAPGHHHVFYSHPQKSRCHFLNVLICLHLYSCYRLSFPFIGHDEIDQGEEMG
jgi:hypothetical protein